MSKSPVNKVFHLRLADVASESGEGTYDTLIGINHLNNNQVVRISNKLVDAFLAPEASLSLEN